MLSRVVGVAVGGGLLASSSPLCPVHAAADHASSSPATPTPAAAPTLDGKKTVRAAELPIYGDPEPVEFELVAEEPSMYHTAISDARKWVWMYKSSVESGTKQVVDAYHVAKKAGSDGLEYIQKDSAVVPRAAVITVAGLGGIVAGYRGRFLRKTFYASLAMGAAAAVCYPRESADISRRGWTAIRDLAGAFYKDNFSPAPAAQKTKAPSAVTGAPPPHAADKSTPPVNKSEKVAKAASSATEGPKSAGGDDKTAAGTTKKDFGMANPKDADMYTTRGK